MDNYKKGQVAYDKKDYDKAISYWKPLAERGNLKAIRSMADLYFTGDLRDTCLPEDYDQALYYFRLGSLQADAYCLYKLGHFYKCGFGVKEDMKRAHKLYLQSTEKGSVCAAHYLATTYYYDDYTGKMQIYQLGSFDGEGDRDVPTYGVEAIEVFPQTLSAVEYNYGSSNQIVKVNVSFAYKQWYNLTTDHLAGVNFGQSRQTVHDVKGADRGLFGRLPIELQRAGREVFNSAKRQVPIGKLFKGKIFPPFT